MTCPEHNMITSPFSDTSLESEISSLIYLESLTLMCIERPTEKHAIFNPSFRVLEKSLEMHLKGYFAFQFYFLAPSCSFLCIHGKDYLKGRER